MTSDYPFLLSYKIQHGILVILQDKEKKSAIRKILHRKPLAVVLVSGNEV